MLLCAVGEVVEVVEGGCVWVWVWGGCVEEGVEEGSGVGGVGREVGEVGKGDGGY